MKKITKSLLAILIAVVGVFVSIMNTSAVSQTIQLGNPESVPGYVAGVHFTTKTTTSGDYLYCLNIHKNTAKNTTATLVGERDAGIAYIIANGYPSKSITGDRLKDYYITQTAVWWYLDDTTGSSNLGQQFKTDGSDVNGLRPHIQALIAGAKTAKANGYATTKLAIKASDTSMTLKDGYYVSGKISASSYSNISSYTVSLTNAPAGTKVINGAGKETTSIGVKDTFTIKVPVDKVTGTSLNIKVTAKATGTVNKAYEYQPSDANMQNVAFLVTEKQEVSSDVTLKIATSKVTVIKIDKATEKALAGAKLVLKDSSGNVLTSWISTTNGHVIQNLKNGTYTISEESAPKGYKLNTASVSFTISDTNRNVTVKFLNEAKQSVVNIVKIDNSTGEALAGAVLVIKDSKGNIVERFTTTTDPHVITNLEDGTYTLEEESAPSGYMLNTNKVTFTIDDEHQSHQITFENAPEVYVPNTASASSIIFTILGIAIIGTGIGFVYKNGKKAK